MSLRSRNTEQSSRVIRELSQSLNRNRASQAPATQDLLDQDTNFTLETNPLDGFETQSSGFSEDILMSTRQRLDELEEQSRFLPEVNLRSSARKFGFYNYNPPDVELRLNTSYVNGQFPDFDQDNHSENDSISIEVPRGVRRSTKTTPAKANTSRDLSGDILFDMGNNSLLGGTPPTRSRTTPKKTNEAETGSLRRDAQIRRASAAVLENSARKNGKTPERVLASKQSADRRRSTLSQMHARVSSEEDDSILEDRPATVTFTTKNTRFGGPRSRQLSNNQGADKNTTDLSLRQTSLTETPQRPAFGTPRSGGNPTQQSFMLPDLPNITELVSGVFKDGTPVFSRTTKARSRFMPASNPARANGFQPSHIPIEGTALPPDEKAIFASLQLLQDRLAQLEQEKAEAEKRIEEQESQIIELKAEKQARENFRRSDSALGSTDGEGAKDSNNWRVQKTKLEGSVEALRARLDRADRKVSVADIATKRVSTERDSLVTQLGVAYYNLEEVKNEKEALLGENETLRNEIDEIRQENEDLRVQLSQFQEDTHKLRRKADRKDSALLRENELLRNEIAELLTQLDLETQQGTQKTSDVRSKTIKTQQSEHIKLRSENDRLRSQVTDLKSQRDEQSRQWASTEAELRKKLDVQDQTTRRLQGLTQDGITIDLVQDNEDLRQQLTALQTQLEEQQSQWSNKETQLRERLERRKQALRESQRLEARVIGNAQKSMHRADEGETTTRQKKRIISERQTRATSEMPGDVTSTKTRSYSKRLSLPETQKQYRSVSTSEGPHRIPNIQDESEVESTTDLSLGDRSTHRSKYEMHGANGSGNETVALDSDNENLTFLQPISREVLERIRRTLEEERIGSRHKINANNGLTQQDTIRSTTSVGKRKSDVLPRKSSLKNLTQKSFTQAEELTGKLSQTENITIQSENLRTQSRQGTEHSTLSQSVHRRRSAPIEMTSAFILPDITVRLSGQNGPFSESTVPKDSTIHNGKNCTICRSVCTGDHATDAKNMTEPIQVPKPVPVSERMPDDIDATMRPAQDPVTALATVIKQLEDEVAHLKLELAEYERLLRLHDVSLGKRKRKAVQAHIAKLIKAIDSRADQIYDLYDVVEGQKELTEKEVEQTLQSIGIDPDMLKDTRKGKRVVIEEREESELNFGNEFTEELPWEGVSDSESLPGLPRN